VMKDDLWFMRKSLELADKAQLLGEVPVGAIIIDSDGKVCSEAFNLKEKNNDPTGHAEIIGIRDACEKRGDWRLDSCTLYVTLEPCPMCLGAIIHSRIQRIVFGAYDYKGGAFSCGYQMGLDGKLNHRIQVQGGLLGYSCSKILSDFFRLRRQEHKHFSA